MCLPSHEDEDARSYRQRSGVPQLENNEPRILIVGAGAAGIACATKLLDFGFTDVFLIEAESRIGGRIDTVHFADNVVDLGAQWCHGKTNNVVYDLVKDKELLDDSGEIFVSFDCVRSNGEVLSPYMSKRLKSMISDIFESRREDLATFKGSFGEYLSMMFNQALEKEEYEDIDTVLAHEFFENYLKIESTESSSEVFEVSGKGLNEYWECNGPYMLNWRDKGYKEILRVLTKANGHELGELAGRITFGVSVEKIIYDRDDGKVEAKCTDHKDGEFLVDHIVLTVSLGVLKSRVRTFFEPQLPPEKRRAIEGIGFGQACKIFMEFPDKFWPDYWTGFGTLWRADDLAELLQTPRAWLENVTGFFCVNHQPRILASWVVGSSVAYVESLGAEQIEEDFMYLLRRFLPEWNIPEPVNIAISDWCTNPNFCGAYSFRSMQTERLFTGARELAQPITQMAFAAGEDTRASQESSRAFTLKPTVLFAGEATSTHYYSTVHGAIESGWREASRLAGYYLKGM